MEKYYYQNMKNEEVKVGDKVKVAVFKYRNFIGTITEIENGMATIEVPLYYGEQKTTTIMQDARFLTKYN